MKMKFLIRLFLLVSIFLIIPNKMYADSCERLQSAILDEGVSGQTSYSSIIIKCCASRERAFSAFWEESKCDCSSLTGLHPANALNQINICVSQSKTKCNEKCLPYVQNTTNGCESLRGNISSQCSEICNNQAHRNQNPFNWIENQLELDRGNCFELSKKRFVEEYKKQCLKMIEEMEREENSTLICKDGATRNNPSCDDFCRNKAEDVHGDKITESTMINCHMLREDYEPSQDCNGMDSTALWASEQGLAEFIIVLRINTLKAKMFNSDGTINDSSASSFRSLPGGGHELSWWLCEKGARPKMSCESNLELALHEAVQSCAELQSAAQECCHSPESCVGGGLAHAMDGLGKMNVAIAAFKGPQAQCDAVQQTHGLYSGMQGAMAAQCTNKSNECVRGCQEKVDKVLEAFKAACDDYPNTGTTWNEGQHSCDKKFFDDYKKAYTSSENQKQVSISSVPDKCKTTGKEANRRINDMTTNAGTSLLASMKECGWDGSGNWKSSFSGGPTGMNVLSAEDDDSTTTGSSSTGGGIQIPELPDPTTTVGGGGNEEEERRGLLPDGLTAQQAVSPFDMEPGLGGEPEEGPPAPAGKMGGLLGGSSGGGGGGLGGLGGGGSAGRGKSGAGAKKGKKVLLGYRGGKFKGYGGGAGGSASGGSRASSRRSASKKGRGMASLDLKKLLPKGKQLNNKIGKYGSPHDDIFKRLSDRIQWMCRTRRINCK